MHLGRGEGVLWVWGRVGLVAYRAAHVLVGGNSLSAGVGHRARLRRDGPGQGPERSKGTRGSPLHVFVFEIDLSPVKKSKLPMKQN